MNGINRVLSILILALVLVAFTLAQETREVHKSSSFGPNGRVYVDTYKVTERLLEH